MLELLLAEEEEGNIGAFKTGLILLSLGTAAFPVGAAGRLLLRSQFSGNIRGGLFLDTLGDMTFWISLLIMSSGLGESTL